MLRSIVRSAVVVLSCWPTCASTPATPRGPEIAAALGFRNGASLDTSSTGRPGAEASGAAAVSCGPGCALAVGGDGFWQVGLRAGVVFCPGGRP